MNCGKSYKADPGENSIGADTWKYHKKVIQKPFPTPKKDRPDLEYKD